MATPVSWHLHQGDCLDRLLELEDASIDAVVTDPPYGIGFMGHEWDQPGDEFGPVRANGRPAPYASGRPAAGRSQPGSAGSIEAGRYDLSPTANRRFQGWCEAWGAEVLRVLKPGGHAVVFGSPRTYHRLTAGLEDAGFEIRDTLAWLFGSGFPKSRNLDGEHAGWGTALKPAHEPIVLARKPLTGTVAATVAEHGTGALHIDACRIDGRERTDYGLAKAQRSRGSVYGEPSASADFDASAGRWPANVVLDEDAAALLDEQTGELGPGNRPARRSPWRDDRAVFNVGMSAGTAGRAEHLPGGGASRFFYCAKASAVERDAGLEHLPETAKPGWSSGDANAGAFQSDGTATTARNVHPTVKPIDLMRWLIRLVTPPGGLVLDPFTGSGTTGCAAVLEGMRFVGVEREASYLAIADARIRWWAAEPDRAAVRTSAGAAPGPVPGQASLLDDEDAA